MDTLQKTQVFLTPIEIELGVDENGMTTARNLYNFLELAQGQFSRWAKANITENEFATENEDWWGFDINVEGNVVKDYKLTAHFAKSRAYQLYCQWLKGRMINGERVKLTNRQMYIGVRNYVRQQEQEQPDQQYWKNFDTLMGQSLLDYLEEERQTDE